MPLPFLAIGAAISGISSLFGAAKGIGMMNQAGQIHPEWNYQESQDAKNMIGLTQTRLNSQNPYANANRRNIMTSQANAMNSIKKAVMDPSQALAMAAATQGQADQSTFQQNQQDLAYDQQNMGNYMNAANVGVNQNNMKNQFMAQKYSNDMSQKNALQTAGQQSVMNAGQSLASTAMGVQTMINDRQDKQDLLGALMKGAGPIIKGNGQLSGFSDILNNPTAMKGLMSIINR